MKTFPVPAIIAATAALAAVPFSLAAAGTLFLTAGLGFIIHADYGLRHRRVRLPRLVVVARRPGLTKMPFRKEPNCLAA